ncbi:MAG TPA: sigma-70 family RNA polymerase sigma factor [Syntrophaceticus sp.]|uniref:DNA-directed RNA polymerase specialized sigma subunit n=1 Tax=Syntrophaceticus schinkii TaxID=499207 RepID=A0A0B7MJ54_9FIRM|nr:sigma-70 family RNA polymerase sigma factor [Syntrophaceticus schinkii]MDD4261974.1 sigma-70 family RNA polymerase sigma factor [Syntrophaceticus schinkii]CEO87667.1 DNA-directed RNA polymerase specialized sigma subunit [Syntrophaceticus schinkii]HHY29749.1 sigma-70 family RNA polymerase sigma factor [Syntrophaceticus sp.]
MSQKTVCGAVQPELDDAVSAYLEDRCEENLRRIFVAASALVHHYGDLYSGSRLSEDIIQAGYEGLMKAVQRFDSNRGVRFVTFASHYIMGEMKRHLRREVSFDRPGWVADLQSHIYRTIEELSQKNGEPPTLDQIAEEVNIRKEGVAQALQAGHVSLDELDIKQVRHLYYESFQLPIEDKIVVRQAMDRLNELQRRVIYLIFYHDLTQQQVADEIGIGQRRVSRLMHRGLESMAEYLA